MKVPLCPLEDIPVDGAKVLDFFGRPLLILTVAGTPKAVLNVCMHLGGPMTRDGDRLICDWHGAEFACQDGRRLAGPARPGSRLIILPTRVENGTLVYVYGE
ncbi:MAG TPA: Rieske 2Fe-2S domain-containing protein [Methylomirabilota bacterium]|nr:Rieske 2Fe-2S domain-containing protein [Methylomirabilota bacterium]